MEPVRDASRRPAEARRHAPQVPLGRPRVQPKRRFLGCMYTRRLQGLPRDFPRLPGLGQAARLPSEDGRPPGPSLDTQRNFPRRLGYSTPR
ncbi:WDR8 protein isoform 3 family protein, partial [Toxoplasma gondii FOU]